jgi:hypothetical protein
MYRMGGRAEHAVSMLRLPRVLVGCVLLRCCTLRRTSCVECDMLHCCGLEVGWMFDQSRRFACGMSQLCAVSCTLHRCCTGSSTSMPYCRGRTRSETSPSAPLPSPSSLAFRSARTRQDRLKQRTLWSSARRSSLMPAHECPRRAHAALQRLAIVPPQPLEPAMPSSCARCNMQPTDLSDEPH